MILNKIKAERLIRQDGAKIINQPIQLKYEIEGHFYLIRMKQTCYCSTRGFGRIRFVGEDNEFNKKLFCTRHEITGSYLKFLK